MLMGRKTLIGIARFGRPHGTPLAHARRHFWSCPGTIGESGTVGTTSGMSRRARMRAECGWARLPGECPPSRVRRCSEVRAARRGSNEGLSASRMGRDWRPPRGAGTQDESRLSRSGFVAGFADLLRPAVDGQDHEPSSVRCRVWLSWESLTADGAEGLHAALVGDDRGTGRPARLIPDFFEWLRFQVGGLSEPDGPLDGCSVAGQPPAPAADHPPEVGQAVERVVRHPLPDQRSERLDRLEFRGTRG